MQAYNPTYHITTTQATGCNNFFWYPVERGTDKKKVFAKNLRVDCDYLGNVRMILTEQTHSGSNSCTMELARAANEENMFGQVDANGVPTAANEVKARFATANIPGQSSGNGWTSNTSAYVSRIGKLAPSKVGPNSLLKVMAGDEVSATTLYYYKNAVVNANSGNTLLSNLLSSLLQAITGSVATPGMVKSGAANITTQLNGSIPFNNATSPDAANPAGANPKAYLTVLFFDERFKFVEEGSAALRVQQAGNNAPALTLANIKAPKNGYAFVYVSNESDEMVYFDNLQVAHVRKHIIEENHFYSYGLKIAGISSRKLPDINEGTIKNNYGYQGDFNEMDEDIGWNDFMLRNYDAQIGRWVQQDPYQEFPSPYTAMGNDPISHVDPTGGFLGLSALETFAVKTLGGAIAGGIIDRLTGGEGGKGVLAGLGVGLLSNVSFSFAANVVGRVGVNVTAGILNNEGISNIGNQAADINFAERSRGGPNINFEQIKDNSLNDIENEEEQDPGPKGKKKSSFNPWGPALIILGQGTIPKNTRLVKAIFGKAFAVGKNKSTSIASITARVAVKKIGEKGGERLLAKYTGKQTAKIAFMRAGGFFGRLVPGVGWGLFAKDVWDNREFLKGTISAGARDFYNQQERALRGDLDQNGWPIPVVCFTKGTLVYGNNKLVPIENIQVGDLVYSYNIEKNEAELSKVINTLHRETEGIYEITAGTETINVTAEHPIYIIGKGFTKVKDLKTGDILKSFDDKVKVQISSIKILSQIVTVYNIEVDGNHNYFVTGSIILVHNKNITEVKEVQFYYSPEKSKFNE